jgi:hypothetical protein
MIHGAIHHGSGLRPASCAARRAKPGGTLKEYYAVRSKVWPDDSILADAQKVYQLLADRNARATRGFRVLMLSAMCHQCHCQCVYVPCLCTIRGHGCDHIQTSTDDGRCLRSVCRRCQQLQYLDRGFAERGGMGTICPPCQGVCNCNKHLRLKSKRASHRRARLYLVTALSHQLAWLLG